MATETMSISLPDTLKRYVEQRVDEAGYGNTSEYIRDLIRQERKRVARERLDSLLIEGLESGEPIEATHEWFENRRARLVAEHQASQPCPESQ